MKNALQLSIMKIVNDWGHNNNEPITLKEVTLQLGGDQVSKDTIKASVRALIKKGYIRRAITRNKGSCYVQLRNPENAYRN
jgi:predicted HTH transcriptional regulator